MTDDYDAWGCDRDIEQARIDRRIQDERDRADMIWAVVSLIAVALCIAFLIARAIAYGVL